MQGTKKYVSISESEIGLTAQQHKKATSRRRRYKRTRFICIMSEMSAQKKK